MAERKSGGSAKMGRWIPDPMRNGYGRYICSACKCPFEVEMMMGRPIWLYCPMCGERKDL